jgi:hypothetical protein
LVELINQLLVDGKDIPEIVDICNEALEVIDSILQMELFEEFCTALGLIFFGLSAGVILLLMLTQGCLDAGYPLEALKCFALCIECLFIMGIIVGIAGILKCAWIDESNQEFNIFKNLIDLYSQIDSDNISEFDITRIHEFIQSYGLNGCPCMQE